MAISTFDLQNFDGRFIRVIDFANNIYEGFLHYHPESQFAIQLWRFGDCCFITYLQIEDVIEIIPTSPNFALNQIYYMPLQFINSGFFPYFIQSYCCYSLPEVLLMDITDAGQNYQCLINKNYILEWNFDKQIFELYYPEFYDCNTLHVELVCDGSSWLLYLAFLDSVEATCVNGVNPDFPLNRETLKGTGKINLKQTGDCTYDSEINETITISIKPAG